MTEATTFKRVNEKTTCLVSQKQVRYGWVRWEKVFSSETMKRGSLCALLIVLTVTGWTKGFITTSEKFTYGGGTLGAWTGAIIGAVSGYTAAGVAVGGSVGAIAGYLIGDSLRQALESDVAKRSKGRGPDEVGAKRTEVTQR